MINGRNKTGNKLGKELRLLYMLTMILIFTCFCCEHSSIFRPKLSENFIQNFKYYHSNRNIDLFTHYYEEEKGTIKEN